tara:strand:+ start:98 stop:931 length:834 start_codon:yes stop_codon:yes gene_type:complete
MRVLLADVVPVFQFEICLMKIASFNINGIKARTPALIDWLNEAKPDVALLQEIKSIDEAFPKETFEDLGYNVETNGQKSFNGVAILSKYPLREIKRGLPGDKSDEQARWIEGTICASNELKICCLYLPNGNPLPGPKYDYKLAWMDRLYLRAQELLRSEQTSLMAGDFNIIPQIEDAATPEVWKNDALFKLESRAKFRKILNLGFLDAFRACNDGPGHYSFWDYQAGAWDRNDGIRIDHFLLSPTCADVLNDCKIDSDIRGREKPSDHVPIWIKLNV